MLSRLSVVSKDRYKAANAAGEKSCQARMLVSRIGLLMDELNLLKRKETSGCGMDIVVCKFVDAKGEVNKFFDGLCHNTFASYANIRQNIDQTLLAVRSRLKDLIDRDA